MTRTEAESLKPGDQVRLVNVAPGLQRWGFTEGMILPVGARHDLKRYHGEVVLDCPDGIPTSFALDIIELPKPQPTTDDILTMTLDRRRLYGPPLPKETP